MAQEYAFDKLARVFDNATAAYVSEAQRKKVLADERAREDIKLADSRNYAKSVRDEERGYVKDDRADQRTYAKSIVDEGRTYENTQRGVLRGEQKEDSTWAGEQATINELIRTGYLARSDANDPAKIDAALAKMSPEAKQRLADRPGLLNDVRAMASNMDMASVLNGRNIEDLSYEELSSVAAVGRGGQADQAKVYADEGLALRMKLEQATEDYNNAVSQIDPTPTEEEIQAARSQLDPYGKGDEATNTLVLSKASESAGMRAAGARRRAEGLARSVNSYTTQLRLLETSARNKTPYQRTPVAPAKEHGQEQQTNPVYDPVAEIKAKRDAAAQAQQEQKSARLAKNTYAADLDAKAQAAELSRNVAQFSDLVPRASMSDEGMRAKIEGMKRPGYSFAPPGMGAPISVGPRSLSTEEKSDEMDALLLDRTTSDPELRKLAASTIPRIKSLSPADYNKLIAGLRKMGMEVPSSEVPSGLDSELARMNASFGNQNFFSK